MDFSLPLRLKVTLIFGKLFDTKFLCLIIVRAIKYEFSRNKFKPNKNEFFILSIRRIKVLL